MKIKTLYKDNEEITLESYLNKCGIDDIEEYLKPSGLQVEPFTHYDNHHKGYELFIKHIKSQSNICLYADIDDDGVTSYAMMYRYIKELNSNIQIFTIINQGKIHGITQDVLDCVYNNKCSLLIVPDAGSSDYEQHKQLQDNNIDILILEHHESEYETPYATIINNQLSQNVCNKFACGASITYKFISYCEQQFSRKMGWKYIDLCACGLIGDIMSLVPIENRTYIYFGLRHITNPFLKYLYDNLIDKDVITPKDVAFSLVPKINALIRENIDEHKYLLLKCFVEDLDEDKYKEMLDICLNAHKQQKKIVQDMYENILNTIDDNNKVIFAFTEKSAYTGLICGKIAEAYTKPTLLIYNNNNEYFGSARSPIPFKDILGDSELMTVNSGHSTAFGVGFKEKDLGKLKEYCNSLELNKDIVYNVTQSFLPNKIPKHLFTEFNDYNELWGTGIIKPQFHISNICINSDDIRVMGKTKTTIKFNYKGVDYIKFFVSHDDQDRVYHIGGNKDLNIELIGEFAINEWNGRITPQAIIDKIEVNLKAKKPMSIDDIF